MRISNLQQYLYGEMQAGNGQKLCQPYISAVPEPYAKKEESRMEAAFAKSFLNYCKQWKVCFNAHLSFSPNFSALLVRDVYPQYPGYWSVRWDAISQGVMVEDVFLVISGILENHDVQNLGDRAVIPWVTPE